MSNPMKSMKATVLGLSLVFAGSVASLPAHAVFLLNFDENGNGSYQVYNNNTGGYDPTVSDSGIMLNGFLSYLLPEVVGLGDASIADPSQTCLSAATCSDGLRFLQDSISNNYYMQFFSQSGGVDQADTGFPSDFSFGFVGATENPDGTFHFVAGDGTPATTNFYNGVSNGESVPEPASIALFGAGILGLGLVRRRRPQ